MKPQPTIATCTEEKVIIIITTRYNQTQQYILHYVHYDYVNLVRCFTKIIYLMRTYVNYVSLLDAIFLN